MVSESRPRSERATPQSLTRRQERKCRGASELASLHNTNRITDGTMQCHCYACLPASADSRRCSLYLPAPVSTILFTEHHDPSHRRYHQDGSAAWTRSGNMLDIADRHSLQPPVLRSLPHGYQHLPTSPRDETQLSIVRTDRSTAPRPSDMPSPPPGGPDLRHTPHGTHGEPA